jgi:pimeloyl-ACP methyl ester carboxylesterase
MVDLDRWPHRYAETNGIRLHYVEAGPEDGRLVVLLHGFPEFWYSWRNQIEALSEAGYRVVAPDLRGYNLSDKPANGYDIPTLVEDIAGLIRAVGRERAVVCGHDWGGGLTWAFASFHPEMTEAVIVANAPHFGPFERELRKPRQMMRSWYMLFFQLPFLPEWTIRAGDYRVIERMFEQRADSGSIAADEIQAYKDAIGTPGALTAALNYYRSAFRGRLKSLLGREESTEDGWPVIEAPTLLIWGTNDVALGVETTRGTEEWVPNLRIEYLQGASHWVQQERAEDVSRLMVDFLNGLPASRALEGSNVD